MVPNESKKIKVIKLQNKEVFILHEKGVKIEIRLICKWVQINAMYTLRYISGVF